LKLSLNQINPNPINEQIYSPSEIDDLEQSLKTHGQLEPIVLTKDHTLISGHRRFYAIKRLGWKECDVRIQDPKNVIVSLIEFNRHRVKSVTDILNESRFLEKELRDQIGKGRSSIKKNGRRMVTVIEVSKKLGVSTTQLKKIKSISNYDPDILARVDSGELSINQGYHLIRKKYINKDLKEVSKEDEFKTKFRKLIKTYQPTKKLIDDTVSNSYPFNIQSLKNGEEKRLELIENLNFLKNLDNRENVLYKKYQEVNKQNLNKKLLKKVEKNLWNVTNWKNKKSTIKEIEQIDPEIVFVDKSNMDEFNILRQNIHSMEYVANPGRLLRCLVVDKPTGKYLGVLTIASDFTSLENRDKFIGWSDTDKYKNGRLKNTAVMSSCVSVQPYGFNCLGGKLMSMVATTSPVRDFWKKKYKDTLVGLTTTSLFGQFSQYDGVPIWKGLGESKGIIYLKPDDEIYSFWSNWLRQHHKKEYAEANSKSSPKQNILQLIFKYLDIDSSKYKSELRRGIYFSSFYDNGKQFLCGDIKEKDLVMNDRISRGSDYNLNWWKDKAIKRYEKLHQKKKLSTNNLWYESIDPDLFKSWLVSRGL
tara:strand:+ start:2549 stop:4315 length:1767 start_codon:yes stop_codon:yes gene_type:complete